MPAQQSRSFKVFTRGYGCCLEDLIAVLKHSQRDNLIHGFHCREGNGTGKTGEYLGTINISRRKDIAETFITIESAHKMDFDYFQDVIKKWLVMIH